MCFELLRNTPGEDFIASSVEPSVDFPDGGSRPEEPRVESSSVKRRPAPARKKERRSTVVESTDSAESDNSWEPDYRAVDTDDSGSDAYEDYGL